jgi:ABC-2 type transport system permease protein
MTRHWFVVAARTSARRTIASPEAFAVPTIFYVLVVLAVVSVWRAATEANGGEIAGYTAVALTWYLAASETAYLTTDSRLIEEIGDEIAAGDVTVELLRPAPVFGVRMATQLGRALPRLALNATVGSGLCLLLAGPPPEPWALLWAAPALVLGIGCNLAAMHAVAAVSFWVRDAKSTWFLYQKTLFILGGMLLPLQVLPEWLEAVAVRLPMMAMIYVPARLASGHVEPELLLVQAGWLVVLIGAAAAVFAAGERRLQVVGG